MPRLRPPRIVETKAKSALFLLDFFFRSCVRTKGVSIHRVITHISNQIIYKFASKNTRLGIGR
jgi:hypothetical protein